MKALQAAIVVVCLALAAAAQQPQAQSGQREVYRVHFFKAAPGKLEDLVDAYKNVPLEPGQPRPALFRHIAGDDWDLLVIYPLGAKFSVEAPTAPPSAQQRAFRERVMADYVWHTDTYAYGPPLKDFQQALGLTAEAPAGRNAVYQASDYSALPGHRAQLESVLDRLLSMSPGRSVKLEHVHGASWDWLLLYRYNNWAEHAAEAMDPDADEKAKRAGFASGAAIGTEFRLHAAGHHDNFVGRVQ